jgi:hypothetical protein
MKRNRFIFFARRGRGNNFACKRRETDFPRKQILYKRASQCKLLVKKALCLHLNRLNTLVLEINFMAITQQNVFEYYERKK